MPSTPPPTPKYSFGRLLRDLAEYLRPYRFRFILASLLRLAGDLAWLYPAIAVAGIVSFFSKYVPGESLEPFWTIIYLLSGAIVVRVFGGYIGKYLLFRVSERVSIDADLKTLRHLFNLDMAWHERENAGNKIKRMQRGSEGLNTILRLWINNIIEITVNFIGITIIVAQADTSVALTFIVYIVSYFGIAFNLTRRAAAASNAVNIKDEEVSGSFYESVNNIRTVKVLGMTDVLFRRLRRETDDLYTKIKTRIFRFQGRNLVLNIWSQAFRIGLLVYVGLGIVEGRFDVGFLVLLYTYFNRIWESIGELSDKAQDIVVAKYAIARMQAIQAEPVGTVSDRGRKAFPKNWRTLSVKELSFTYSEREVLHELNFEIKRGEKIGIVGLSGAGKSTLFKLFLKEDERYSGEIAFDGLPLRKIRSSSYYEHAAVVLQDTEVFNLPLKENITIATVSGNADKKRFNQAIKVAHVDDFIGRLPLGVETPVGEKGIRLSGGEKQRVGIARAVFKQPQILFLDEATSHLDLESEEKIRDSLHKFFRTVTAVVIAHRLTTIKLMDRILVMEGGRIIESGTFDELYAKGGRFFQLWEKQGL